MKELILKAGRQIEDKLNTIQSLRDELQEKLDLLSEEEQDALDNDPELNELFERIEKIVNEIW